MRKSLIAVMLMAVMVLSLLSILPVGHCQDVRARATSEVASESYTDISLYLDREGEGDNKDFILTTIVPKNETEKSEDIDELEAFILEPALSGDLEVVGDEFTLVFWVDLAMTGGVGGGEIKVNITISVFDGTSEKATGYWYKESGSTTGPWTYTTPEDNPESVDMNLNNNWDNIFKNNIKLGFDLNVDTDGVVRTHTEQLLFDSEVYDTHLKMDCAPVKITANTYGKNKNTGAYELTSVFEPYLPSSLTHIKFKGAITDVFGDEDVIDVYLYIEKTKTSGFYSVNLTEDDHGGVEADPYSYEWDYSGEAPSNKTYQGKLEVRTRQHVYVQWSNFTFSQWGVYLEADKTGQVILPTETATYKITVWNSGTEPCNIDVDIDLITKSEWGEWRSSPSDTYDWHDYFAKGEHKTFTIEVTPTNVTGIENAKCKLGLKAKIRGIEVEYTMDYIETSIAKPYEVEMEWDENSQNTLTKKVVGGRVYELKITVTNLGGNTDDINVSVLGSPEWPVSRYPSQLSDVIGGGGTGTVTLTVTVPTEVSAPDSIDITIQGKSVGAESHPELSPVTDNITLHLTRILGIHLSVDQASRQVNVTMSTGKTTFELGLTNKDDVEHTVKLTIKNDAYDWAEFDNGEVTRTVSLTSGGSRTVDIIVSVPANTYAGDHTIVVNASIKDLSDYWETLSLTTVINPYYGIDVVIVGDAIQKGEPGKTLQYTIKVTNNGNTADSIILTKSGPNSHWALFEGGKEDKYTVTDLAPDASKNITLTVTLPKDTAEGERKITITGTSTGDTSEDSAATATIKVELSDLWRQLLKMFKELIALVALFIVVIIVAIVLWKKSK